MQLSNHTRMLFRSLMAGAVVLTGVSACSRSDRAAAGRDTTRAEVTGTTTIPADTQTMGTQPVDTTSPAAANIPPTPDTAVEDKDRATSGYRAMEQSKDSDTTNAPADQASVEATTSHDTVAVGDSTETGKTGERLDDTAASAQANADAQADQAESDRVRPPEDSSETLGAVTTSDSAVAGGSTEMARDTSTTLAQGDTTAPAQTDTDTVTIQAGVDTTTAGQQTEVAVETQADTAVVVGDSTEVVTTDQTEAKAQDADVSADEAAVGAAGVQSTGNIATGADAVALTSREGQRCTVVDSDVSREVQWDLAASPATMNPCGTGTMTLPRVQTEK